MNRIFSISNDFVPNGRVSQELCSVAYSTKWIEINDSCVDLSEIELTENKCIVPYHIYEDSLIDNEKLILYSESNKYIIYPRSMFWKYKRLGH